MDIIMQGCWIYKTTIMVYRALRGRMTAKEGPSSFTFVSANISWRFVRLDLKSCFEVHLARYEVGCYW
jgi:hypothetical protein